MRIGENGGYGQHTTLQGDIPAKGGFGLEAQLEKAARPAFCWGMPTKTTGWPRPAAVQVAGRSENWRPGDFLFNIMGRFRVTIIMSVFAQAGRLAARWSE